jgi:hypothetical protein
MGQVRPGTGIDPIHFLDNNQLMSTADTNESGIAADIMAELKYAAELAATGRKDAAFAKRIAEEAARIRDSVKRKHGLLDIGVPAIRELRDE